MKKQLFTLLCLSLVLFTEGVAQSKKMDVSSYKNLKWRSIGPYRGGRSIAVAGHADQPLTYYFGATGGGVWKSVDGGMKWFSVQDATFKSSSVGAISVAGSDANTIYVGMGETDIRGNISMGDGMYKSSDAGKTWRHIGLKKSSAISKIAVHPKNENVLLVAALGNPFGRVKKAADSEERGVYLSNDGGTTWTRTLAPTTDQAGAIDVHYDPTNPTVVYAAMWDCYRNNFMMSSGGEGSGLYKSVDGGATWKNISQNAGLPVGILGKIGIAVSHKGGNRVWAIIESKNGGLFRSDDAGESWTRISTDKNLWQRPWYYCEIEADPSNHDGLHVLNVNYLRTTDGGKTFNTIQVGHGDVHDIWVNPKNAENYILGDDGGAEVTYNGGRTWTELDLPTAQFYHVSVDNDLPYNVYGAQQDNSTIKIKSRSFNEFRIDEKEWIDVAGGESGYLVADKLNSDISYGGSYMGYLSKYNSKTGLNQNISPNPTTYLGDGSDAMKYRFQWTFPIVISPHDPKTIYATSNFVHKTTDGGNSWTVISPDLSKNDPATLGSSGGPITKDNTGAETFGTIFTFAESPVKAGVFYAGTDDGLFQVSQDGGKTWNKTAVTGLGDWALMSIVEASYFDAGTAYLAANRYKVDDTKPYLFKTTDFGKTWKKITEGLPEGAFCRVIREDPARKGLLYAGTEIGIFVSFNDGDMWYPLNNNLPLTPIHDIQIQARESDLVVATHGRSFWILDNLDPIRQLANDPSVTEKKSYLFKPEDAWRVDGAGGFSAPDGQVGENAPNAVHVSYFLKEKPKDEILFKFTSINGDSIITYSSKKDRRGKPIEVNKDFYTGEQDTRGGGGGGGRRGAPSGGTPQAEVGGNTFLWDMRLPDAIDTDPPSLMWAGSVQGPKVPPGKYFVEMVVGNEVIGKQQFEIKHDPRSEGTAADVEANVKYQLKVRDKLSETHTAINELRATRKQITDYMATVLDAESKKEMEKISKPMLENLQKVEDELIQHKAKAFQDLLALPPKLNNKLASLISVASSVSGKPTAQLSEAFAEIIPQVEKQLATFRKVMDEDVPKFNQAAEAKRAPAIARKIKP